tara:strand:- start:355 stop:753 length:399 start_codon:yes stop_codon:yes gene_type:complete
MKVYTTKTCPYCKTVKQKLEEADINFTEKDTTEFREEYNNIVSATGLPNVPTIIFKDNIFQPGRDFYSPDHLVDLLKNFVPTKYNNEEVLLEKLKTLTYNIQTAFGRTDQILRKIENKLNTLENDRQQKQND